jgi:polysaccharide biosynthesis/export protein
MRYSLAVQKISFSKVICSIASLVAVASLPVFSAVAQTATPVNPAIVPSSPTVPLPSNQPLEPNRADYILGAGDQIQITVMGYDEFTGVKTVLPDGNITLPLVGQVAAAGKTQKELTQELTARLNTLLVEPSVTISLATLRPVIINVAGEVQRPGQVQFNSLTAANTDTSTNTALNNTPTVNAALVSAGGITQYADIRQITLQRYSPDHTVEPITINLWDAIASSNAPPDLILQDGDSLFVPRLSADSTIDRRLMARSSLAPQTIRVRVVGEVVKPGEVLVPPNSSLSSAIAIAGGPTQEARLSRVAFVRMGEQNEIERQVLDLQNLTDNYQVQDGDVIIVPKRGSSQLIDVAGRVLSPLGFLVNLFTGL